MCDLPSSSPPKQQQKTKHKTKGRTDLNERSSRSHAIFTLHLTRWPAASRGGVAYVSKLHLVDLAGSERSKATNATGAM